jgi:hypothetical protein
MADFTKFKQTGLPFLLLLLHFAGGAASFVWGQPILGVGLLLFGVMWFVVLRSRQSCERE